MDEALLIMVDYLFDVFLGFVSILLSIYAQYLWRKLLWNSFFLMPWVGLGIKVTGGSENEFGCSFCFYFVE